MARHKYIMKNATNYVNNLTIGPLSVFTVSPKVEHLQPEIAVR
jgi:hypothetical protein